MKKLMIGLTATTGTAADPHKENDKGVFEFVEGGKAFKKFKIKAKWLTRRNNFNYEESATMEALALEQLLEVDFLGLYRAGKIGEGYVCTAISHALTNAAQKVADDRRVWGASRQSLDAQVGEGEDSRSFVDLVSSHGDLNRQRKVMGMPRPVAYRWALNRHKRNVAATRKILARLLTDPEMTQDLESETAELDEEMKNLVPETAAEKEVAEEESLKHDDFAGDSEDLNKTEFKPDSHHEKAVAEVGYFETDEDWMPQTQHKSSAMGLGSSAEEVYEAMLRIDVALVIEQLEDEKDKAWCRRVLEGWDPADAYRFDFTTKSDFYKKMRPRLQKAFAALKYAVGQERN